MRKRYRVFLLAAIVAALVVPVGFALSLESAPMRTSYSAAVTTAPAAVASSIILKPVPVEPATTPFGHSVTDSAKLLLVGTALFGLAAAVRRAI